MPPITLRRERGVSSYLSGVFRRITPRQSVVGETTAFSNAVIRKPPFKKALKTVTGSGYKKQRIIKKSNSTRRTPSKTKATVKRKSKKKIIKHKKEKVPEDIFTK